MPPQRNPWIGSLYAIAAMGLIAATYFVPRHLEVTARYIGSVKSDSKEALPLSTSLVNAPDDLVPVGGGELYGGPAVESLEVATAHGEEPTSADSQSSEEQEAIIRAKPIMTDTSVVADN